MMRGLAVVALLLGGLPIVTFVATLALSDGAPLQSPIRGSFSGSGMPVTVHVTPELEHGQPVSDSRAGIPTPIAGQVSADWRPPDSHRLARHRTDAAWDRLDRQAAGGNRDALLFRTLMQSADFAVPLRANAP